MPKKCDHLDECDDCAKRIPEPLSEQVTRIQQIVLTMERKRRELAVAISNENRFKISIQQGVKDHRKAVESAEESLANAKVQLGVEIRKLDAATVVEATKEVVNA